LNEGDWNGAVFAAAGLERINLKPEFTFRLMIPAPAQGSDVVAMGMTILRWMPFTSK
jgi:hydroxymethylbilane synthase